MNYNNNNENNTDDREFNKTKRAVDVGKRFEDIKKKYSGNSAVAANSKTTNKNSSNEPVTAGAIPSNPKKINIFSSLFKDTSSEIIASKRELFFKTTPSHNHLPSTTQTSSNHNLNASSHYGSLASSSSPTSLSTHSSLTSQDLNIQNHANHLATANITDNHSASPFPNTFSTTKMPLLASVGGDKGSSPYDYSDREKPLSSYLPSSHHGMGLTNKPSHLANKYSANLQQLGKVSGGLENEDGNYSYNNRFPNGAINPNPSSFATELANKKRTLLQNNNNNREGTTSPPNILSASVTGGGGGKENSGHLNQNGMTNGNINNIVNGNLTNGYHHNSSNTNHVQPPTGTVVEKCIGFANLPNQFYRRAVKKGFEFTLMVVGESGLGKSTLINSLFLTDIYSEDFPGPSHRIKKTVEVETSKQVLVENGVQLSLTIVDTPGFGDSVNNSECWQKILDHIEFKYDEYLNKESKINRRTFEDSRIHCCLYFIAPSGHGLKELDIKFMKKLHEKVNILPLIAKADTMTPDEIHRFKKRILNEIKQNNINIYEFPSMDDPEENKRNRELKDKVPFAIMGSNMVYDLNNRKIRGRKYPWGIAEVENNDHCDFSALRDMLIRRHMQHMKDVTANVLYENFRCFKLSGGCPDAISDMDNPLTQLLEERREQEANLKRTEREMEQVFTVKVKEKETKIKESEAELEKRYEQMKKNLEEQLRELEDRRRNFEAERHAWENGIPSYTHQQNGTSQGYNMNGGDISRPNEGHAYLNGNNNAHTNSSSNLNMMSSNSTLNSLSSNKKNIIQYSDANMKEAYDEKDKKKEKKRFF
ncbi:protein peanut-like isoform X2 [Gordionus sp. m RMFG-2023]|uniref:protein peanut-like isoform X2 n=1 Tax=Gordionus sp. m RMFG-2023 TaxID=3053472 RepID=UPI0031FBC8CF